MNEYTKTNEFDALKITVAQYENAINNINKMNEKEKDFIEKIRKNMNLLIAIADKDKEKIANFRNIETWNNSKATLGYINYFKGVSL